MRYRYMRFPDGKIKAVTFSYDDGPIFDIRLAEIFTKYGMKGTFNLNSFNLPASSTENKIGVDDVRKYMLEKGHEVAVHGEKHIAPAAALPIDSIKEVLFGRLGLEEKLDMTIRGMAYPDSGIRNELNGNSAERVKAQLRDLGIVYSRTLGGDNDQFKIPTDWHAWMPTAHHDNPQIFEFIDKFLAIDFTGAYCASRWPRLFYVWGHSFEFDRKNNWERIEQICEKLSGKDDTWYATNIEIYDYVKAYEALEISADGTRVYNPTLKKIWFEVDGVLFSVDSGEHIRITSRENEK